MRARTLWVTRDGNRHGEYWGWVQEPKYRQDPEDWFRPHLRPRDWFSLEVLAAEALLGESLGGGPASIRKLKVEVVK